MVQEAMTEAAMTTVVVVDEAVAVAAAAVPASGATKRGIWPETARTRMRDPHVGL